MIVQINVTENSLAQLVVFLQNFLHPLSYPLAHYSQVVSQVVS